GSRSRPDEGTGLFVMFADVAANGGDKRRHAAEGPPPQPLAGDLSKEAFDEIQPGRPGWGEVEMKPRVRGEPRLHGRVLVGPIIVENEVDGAPPRGVAIDRVQEGHALGVGMARLTTLDHVALEDIQRGEERGRAVPLVIMR